MYADLMITMVAEFFLVGFSTFKMHPLDEAALAGRAPLDTATDCPAGLAIFCTMCSFWRKSCYMI
jgi:hypothetical protein